MLIRFIRTSTLSDINHKYRSPKPSNQKATGNNEKQKEFLWIIFQSWREDNVSNICNDEQRNEKTADDKQNSIYFAVSYELMS